jgi:hypothetical protein
MERHAVVLQAMDPPNEMEMLFNEPDYESKIKYINGNLMSS